MSESKHTPGNWTRDIPSSFDSCHVEFAGSGHYIALGVVGRARPVAFVIGGRGNWRDDHEVEANARLISAAPHLLATLKAVFEDRSATIPGKLRDKMRTAIAKATQP